MKTQLLKFINEISACNLFIQQIFVGTSYISGKSVFSKRESGKKNKWDYYISKCEAHSFHSLILRNNSDWTFLYTQLKPVPLNNNDRTIFCQLWLWYNTGISKPQVFLKYPLLIKYGCDFLLRNSLNKWMFQKWDALQLVHKVRLMTPCSWWWQDHAEQSWEIRL